MPLTRTPIDFSIEAQSEGSQTLLRVRSSVEADATRWEQEWRPSLPPAEATWPWSIHIPRGERENGFACITVESSLSVEALMSLSMEASTIESNKRLVDVE